MNKSLGEFDANYQNYPGEYKNSLRYREALMEEKHLKPSDDRNKVKDFEDINQPSSFNNQDKHKNYSLKVNNPKTNNLDISIFLESGDKVQVPTQDIIDKINFTFNSMSKVNIAEKSNELKNILNNVTLLKWFSNYFIVNRVSGENNNHSKLYE